MSQKSHSTIAVKRRTRASVFAALGDKTRLALVAKLARGRSCSISQLTKGAKLTRQGVTKHLRVLENVGMVRSFRTGRENRFEFRPRPVQGIKKYLDSLSERIRRCRGSSAVSKAENLVDLSRGTRAPQT